MESVPSLQEELRTGLKSFLCGKDVCNSSPGSCKSLIYQLAPLLVEEEMGIVIDGDRQPNIH